LLGIADKKCVWREVYPPDTLRIKAFALEADFCFVLSVMCPYVSGIKTVVASGNTKGYLSDAVGTGASADSGRKESVLAFADQHMGHGLLRLSLFS
jgi:hypothetical protein